MAAFDNLGGVKYLEEVGRTNPAVFVMLLGRILPHELATSGGGLKHEVLLLGHYECTLHGAFSVKA